MAEIHCPICNRLNDANAERCWYCQANLHETSSQPPEKSDGLSDLRDNFATTPPPEEEPTPTEDQTQEPDPEIPDWLARIRLREQAERETQDESPSETSKEPKEPDWLKEIGTDKATESSTLTPAPTPAFTTDISDEDDNATWLKQLETWRPISSSHPQEPQKPSETQKPVSEAGPSSLEEAAPDWMKALMHDAPPAPEPPVQEIPPASETPVKPEPAAVITQPTDILADDSSTVPVASNPAKEEPEKAASSIGWLADFKGIEPDQDLTQQVIPASPTESETKAPFSNNDMSDWLEPESAKELPSEAEPSAAKEEPAKLEPTALPAWIRALDPQPQNEPAVTQNLSSKGHAEKMGPLAGIEGALQGEEISQFYTHPQPFTGPLKVSDLQQARTQMLKNIADQSHWEKEDLKEKSTPRRWILRFIVALLLLAAVFVPALMKGIPAFLPALYPDAVVQTFTTLNTLPADKPVLVAADFDGSLYGELNWSMQPLFHQLMSRNIPIVFLSTNQVGTVLMQKSLTDLSAQIPAYDSAHQIIDLGYLPGGSIGLQALARDPRSALSLDANLKPAWLQAPLQSVKSLSDFGALIVVTENADTARYWIEQVQSQLGTTPMLVIVSAQSAPLLQPYYDSGQIKGYLSGLSSAAALEALQKTPQNATAHFAAYQLALLLVALLIFVGGVFSLILYRPEPVTGGGKK